MPMTLAAPDSLAICPAMLPTAPAAPETTTVSPSFSLPVSSRPKYAVSPVNGDVRDRHRELAGPGSRRLFLRVRPVGLPRQPAGPGGQPYLVVYLRHAEAPRDAARSADRTLAPARTGRQPVIRNPAAAA